MDDDTKYDVAYVNGQIVESLDMYSAIEINYYGNDTPKRHSLIIPHYTTIPKQDREMIFGMLKKYESRTSSLEQFDIWLASWIYTFVLKKAFELDDEFEIPPIKFCPHMTFDNKSKDTKFFSEVEYDRKQRIAEATAEWNKKHPKS
jgi:hypothetical protein